MGKTLNLKKERNVDLRRSIERYKREIAKLKIEIEESKKITYVGGGDLNDRN